MFSIKKLKPASRWLMVAFYLLAGINHFVNPAFYLPLIPDYLVWKEAINLLSGIAEIALAVGLMFSASQRWAAYGIVAMLLAFVPSHVHFIVMGGCVAEGLCVPMWVAWLRLVLVHPVLIGWAWWHKS